MAHSVSDHAQLMCGNIADFLPYGLWLAHNDCPVLC